MVITPSDNNTTYAEMVKSLKNNIDVKKIGVQVHKVHDLGNGDIQIQFTGRGKCNVESFEKEVAGQMGEGATTKIIEKSGTVVIRDLEPDIEQCELEKAIKEIVGEQYNINAKIMDTTIFRGLKHAFVTLPAAAMRRLLQRPRIHVGWSRCRVEEKFSPGRCFKCLELGHVAAKCQEKEDKAKRCFKCGESDHIIKDCKNAAKCIQCNITGHKMDSMLCPVYAKYVNDHRNNKRGLKKNGTDATDYEDKSSTA